MQVILSILFIRTIKILFYLLWMTLSGYYFVDLNHVNLLSVNLLLTIFIICWGILISVCRVGAIWTRDPMVPNHVFYQLNYYPYYLKELLIITIRLVLCLAIQFRRLVLEFNLLWLILSKCFYYLIRCSIPLSYFRHIHLFGRKIGFEPM